MSMERDIVLGMVKPGDVLEITPIDKLPNFERNIKVDVVRKDCFLYGLSETCDGYSYPFWAIKSLKIVKG